MTLISKPQPPTMEEIQNATHGLIMAYNHDDMTFFPPEYLPIIIDWLVNLGGISDPDFNALTNEIDSCIIKFSETQFLQFWGA